jgi:hypothetical protein
LKHFCIEFPHILNFNHFFSSTKLLSLLESPYGSLRETAVEQLFDHVTLSSSIDVGVAGGGGSERILELLRATDWSSSTSQEVFSATRKELQQLLLLPR